MITKPDTNQDPRFDHDLAARLHHCADVTEPLLFQGLGRAPQVMAAGRRRRRLQQSLAAGGVVLVTCGALAVGAFWVNQPSRTATPAGRTTVPTPSAGATPSVAPSMGPGPSVVTTFRDTRAAPSPQPSSVKGTLDRQQKISAWLRSLPVGEPVDAPVLSWVGGTARVGFGGHTAALPADVDHLDDWVITPHGVVMSVRSGGLPAGVLRMDAAGVIHVVPTQEAELAVSPDGETVVVITERSLQGTSVTLGSFRLADGAPLASIELPAAQVMRLTGWGPAGVVISDEALTLNRSDRAGTGSHLTTWQPGSLPVAHPRPVAAVSRDGGSALITVGAGCLQRISLTDDTAHEQVICSPSEDLTRLPDRGVDYGPQGRYAIVGPDIPVSAAGQGGSLLPTALATDQTWGLRWRWLDADTVYAVYTEAIPILDDAGHPTAPAGPQAPFTTIRCELATSRCTRAPVVGSPLWHDDSAGDYLRRWAEGMRPLR